MKKYLCRFNKGSEEWMFFQDLYNLLQSFYGVQNIETKDERKEFYTMFKEEREELLKKYNYSALAKAGNDFLVSVIVNRDVGKEHECNMILEYKEVEVN